MSAKNFEFEEIKNNKNRNQDHANQERSANAKVANFKKILDIPVTVSVQLGRVRMTIDELVRLRPGMVVELNKIVGEPLDIYVNDKLVAKGEAVISDDKVGVRITQLFEGEESFEDLSGNTSSAA